MSDILNVINYFWKLGFNEETPNVYGKVYPTGEHFRVDFQAERLDFGPALRLVPEAALRFSQRAFVVFESIDRLLSAGWPAGAIHADGHDGVDYTLDVEGGAGRVAVKCARWEEGFDDEVAAVARAPALPPALAARARRAEWLCLYTSRLKAGVVEHRCRIFPRVRWCGGATAICDRGLFEPGVNPRAPVLSTGAAAGDVPAPPGFAIRDGMLVGYPEDEAEVVVPSGVTALANGLFWGAESLRRVVLPDGLRSLGGDTFYGCPRLAEIVIPESVEVIGDNPFAGCPELELRNQSPRFVYQNGILQDAGGQRVIHCSPRAPGSAVEIPPGTISVGKHAFYRCQRLRRIVLPESVRIVENNPFSEIPLLRLESRSPHFVLRDGVLYNSTLGTLFYCEHARDDNRVEIPEGVGIVGRHSFYACTSLWSVTLPASVTTIGYNPFAGCTSLGLVCRSPRFVLRDLALYDREMTELVHYAIASPRAELAVPRGVHKLGRSACFGSAHLRRVLLPDGLVSIERSAFARCRRLAEVRIPESVASIGEWAFRGCPELRSIEVPAGAVVARRAFDPGTRVIRRGA